MEENLSAGFPPLPVQQNAGCVWADSCSLPPFSTDQCVPGGATQPPPNQGTPTVPSTPTTTGSGGGGSQTTSVAATYTVDPSLPGNTIYRPVNMQAFSKMPVMVWGVSWILFLSLPPTPFFLTLFWCDIPYR